MATVTIAYDHSRDPMHPGDLAERLASQFNLTVMPEIYINPTQIIVRHPNVTSANTAAIQTVINAYVLDPVRASFPAGNLGSMMAKAKQAVDLNGTFLAIASPSNAQIIAQVQRLTRENTAIIKILLDDVSDTAGT